MLNARRGSRAGVDIQARVKRTAQDHDVTLVFAFCSQRSKINTCRHAFKAGDNGCSLLRIGDYSRHRENLHRGSASATKPSTFVSPIGQFVHQLMHLQDK